MDNENIVKLFRDDDGPGLSPAAKRRIVTLATQEFERARPPQRGLMGRFAPMLAAAACAAIVFGFWAAFRQAPMTDAERQKTVLAEFNTVFGTQLQAVITDDGKTQILLADKGAQRGQPVIIHLSGQGHNIDIMSFSGENVSLNVGGQQVSFDALVDGKGGVILAGEKLFWNGGTGKLEGAPDIQIKAQALEM
ncbi:MAG: hypothetical protein ACAH83_12925 [Alphaproteobacteria bacterium]